MSDETVVKFEPFKKIPRWSREVIITEKIDGTNASVIIDDTGSKIWAASRNRVLQAGSDNFGWYAWVQEHKEELLKLGPGQHFGEWWGKGIQRGYGLDEKRFSLFNVKRWGDASKRPACCGVVPQLAPIFNADQMDVEVARAIALLGEHGSVAAPGFMDPEGIVIYHVAGDNFYKKTLKNDEKAKGQVSE